MRSWFARQPRARAAPPVTPNITKRMTATVQFTERLLLPNGSRLSCGALKKNSFLNLRAPPASSAC